MWLHQQWRSLKKEPVEKALVETYREPLLFWRELWALQDSVVGAASRSLFHSHYDLYYDCVERHLGRRRVAFRYITRDGVQDYTFDDIHGYVCWQQRRWQRSWVGDGAHVAIVMPLSIELVVGLLTVLRLGLSFSYLPTDSKSLSGERVKRKLEELSPTVTLSVPAASSLVESHHPLLLIEELEVAAESTLLSGASYPRHQRLQGSLNSYSRDHGAWQNLTAEETYLYALRDGLFPVGLRPGVSWCYPMGCGLKEQPSQLIASMLCGATTVVVKELSQHPELLQEHSIDILGISPQLRKHWSEGSQTIPRGVKFWYRHLCDREDSWSHFAKRHRLDHLPSSGFLVNSSDGGMVLFTIPSVGSYTLACWPAVGSGWTLKPLDRGSAAAKSYGIFTPQHSEKGDDGVLILSKAGEQWHLAGSEVPERYGETVPISGIEEVAEALPFVEYALLLPLSGSEAGEAYHYTMLIFVSPLRCELLKEREGVWRGELMAAIEDRQGEAFLPEEIVFYPLYPKLSSSKAERKNILFNYINKILDGKKKINIYNALHSLRYILKKS